MWGRHAGHKAHMEVRGQLCRLRFLCLPLLQGLNTNLPTACLQEPLPRSVFLGTVRLWSVERVVSITQQKFRKGHKNTHYDESWNFLIAKLVSIFT